MIFPRIALVIVAVLIVSSSSCDRVDRSTNDPDSVRANAPVVDDAPAVSLTPVQTAHRVHELRIAGSLEQLEPYVVPRQRQSIVELIQAIDRIVAADLALRASITEHLGSAAAVSFDHSQAANAIGIFSRDLTVLSERIKGDEATVTFQIAKRVPLDEVRLVRFDGRWMIQTDPPVSGLTVELRKLADVLIRTAQRLEGEKLTLDQLKRELVSQQAPITRRIAELTQRKP